MAVSNLLTTFFNNLNGLLIGRLYSRTDLAYVNKGRALPNMAMNEVDATLGRVSFPALVLLQDDKVRLRDAMRRMMICSTFLVMPPMVLVAACARAELRLLYGPQWTPAAPYMMLACFTYALYPFHTINLRGIMALGRSDVFLKLEILKKSLALVVVLCASRLGVFPWMAISAFALGPLSVLINSWPNRKLLNYSIGMQIMDVLPTALVCIAEAVVVFGIDLMGNSLKPALGVADEGVSLMVFLSVKLVLQFILGLGTFFSLAYVFRLVAMGEYARMLAGLIKGRFPKVAVALERRFVV
jgi:O-antigen/teichoic acid export membrane protein